MARSRATDETVVEGLQQILDPARFPNMSPPMAAMLGFLFGRAYTTPALAELVVTPDGHVLGRAEGELGPPAYLAAEADLRANRRRLGMAAYGIYGRFNADRSIASLIAGRP